MKHNRAVWLLLSSLVLSITIEQNSKKVTKRFDGAFMGDMDVEDESADLPFVSPGIKTSSSAEHYKMEHVIHRHD